MKIYISGPISGQDYIEAQKAFADAERVIREAGHTPVSPFNNGLPPGSPYEDHLVEDIRLLLASDAIMLLYGWRGSKGSRIENNIAMNMGKIVFTSFGSLRHCGK